MMDAVNIAEITATSVTATIAIIPGVIALVNYERARYRMKQLEILFEKANRCCDSNSSDDSTNEDNGGNDNEDEHDAQSQKLEACEKEEAKRLFGKVMAQRRFVRDEGLAGRMQELAAWTKNL